MPINNNYDEAKIISAVATAVENFYTNLINSLNSLKIQKVISRKNPYLFRAKDMKSAPHIIEVILSAFVSSSEETIFGNVFFEPIAKAAGQGNMALAEGIDVMIHRDNTVYAIAVKSGTSVFNSSSKKKQEQNFLAGKKLADLNKAQYNPIIGYGYGKKRPSSKGLPKIYKELAGQKFWEELTGDENFYLKLIDYMKSEPEKYFKKFEDAYDKATNKLINEFTTQFCLPDGSINWKKIVEFNSGNPPQIKESKSKKLKKT